MAKDYSALKKQFLESTKDFEEKLMLAKSNIIRSSIYVTDTQDKLTDEATLDTIRNQIIANKKIANINISLDSISLVVSRYSQKVDTIENVYAREYLNNFSKSGQLNRWTPGGATLVSDNIKGYALKLTTAGRMEAYSDMFEVSPTNTFKVSFSLNNPNINNAGTVAFKIVAYDKNKNAVNCKLISSSISDSLSPELFTSKATTNNTYQTFSGYIYGCNTEVDINVPKGEMNNACKLGENVRYISIRLVLNCTEPLGDGNSHSIYIADPFIGDIDNSVVSINKQLSEAFIKLEPGNIQQVVKETTYTKEEVNKKVTTVEDKVTNVNDKVDNLQVGGRNLLVGGKFTTYVSYNTLVSSVSSKLIKTQWVASYTGNTITLSNNGYKPKGVHTISGFLKVNGEIPSSKYFTGLINTYGGSLQANYYDSSTGYFYITQDFPGTTLWIIHAPTTRTSGSTDIVDFIDLKFEKGNRATDWTPSPEDIDKDILDVNTKSEQALSSLSDLANDNKLTPNEKQSSAKEWNIIDVQYARICEDATRLGVSTSDLTTKHHALRDYLSPLFSNMTTTTDINGSEFKDKFKAYYNSQQVTLNALSIKAKEVADGVQNNLDNLQIGVRNIIKDGGMSVTNSNYLIQTYYTHVPLETGKTYTIVLRGSISEGQQFGLWYNGGNASVGRWDRKPGSAIYTKTFTITEALKTDYLSVYNYPSTTGKTATIDWVCLYEGDVKPPLDYVRPVEDIQIGGRNLQLNSAPTTNTGWSWAGTAGTVTLVDESTAPRGKAIKATFTASGASGGMHKPPKERLKVGAIYSWSVWIKASKAMVINLGCEQGGSKEFNIGTEWQKVTYTFTATDRQYQSFVMYAKNIVAGDSYLVHSLKVETGNIPTDWTIAPEDYDSEIADADKKGQDALNNLSDLASDNKLTPNEKQQAKKDWDVIAVEKPKIEAEAVKFGVDKVNFVATYNTLANYLSPLFANMTVTSDIVGNTFRDTFKNYYTAKQDLLNAISSALKISADNANNKIDNLDIGGRNLFKGYKYGEEIRLNDYQNVGGFTQFTNNLTFDPAEFIGSKFTISFWAKSPNGQTQLKIYNQNGDPRYFFFSTTLDEALNTTWRYYTYTFTNTDRGASFNISNKLEIYAPQKMGVLVKHIKIEKGNKATDWIPAPEDVQEQIDATNKVVETQTSKVSKIETSLGQISSKVETLETTEVVTRKVSSFRYLRDWLKGSTANGGNHTCEIQVWAGDTNIAQGKIPTSNMTPTNPTFCTDGKIDGTYTSFGDNSIWCYLQIDLGSDRTDIDMIKLWHYYADGRAYNHKLEVSRDGVTWYELFNSDKSGKYSESSKGRTYIINESYTETRLKTAEQKITDDAITATVAKKFYTKNDIDGKGYFNESQVQQTVDKLEVKFTETGGYNLLYNSAFANNEYEFWFYTNGAEPWGDQSYYKNVGDMFIKNSTAGNAHFGHSGDIKVKPGVKYSASLSASKEGNVKGGAVYIDCYNNGTYVTTLRQQLIFDSKRHTYLFTFASNVTHVRFYIEHSGSTSTSGGFLIQLNKPCFTEGEIAVWSPHPSELCDGIITATKDGIIVRNSDADTYTRINAESFAVNDSRNATVAEFGRSSLIPNLNCPGTLTAGNIFANNACTKTTEYKTNKKVIFVQGNYGNDSNNGNSWATSEAIRTVGEAIRRLPELINQHIEIHIGGSVSGFEMSGRDGCGTITFIFEDDCVVNSQIILDGISSKVNLNGNGSRKGTLKKELYAFRCAFLNIHHLSFRGGDAGANVHLHEGTNAVLEENDMGHTWCAIAVGAGCSVAVRNNRGSELDWYVACGLFSRTYFKSIQADYVPDSKFGMETRNGDDGTAFIHKGSAVNWIKIPSEGWNPTYTPTQRVTTWNFNNIWSDETLNGWSNVSELVQGYYSGWSTGRWTGYMQMSDGMSDIRSTISGGTNLSGRIYVQRRTSSGNSTGSLLCLYASDGTLITNSTRIDRGQGVWVSLSSSIIQKIQSGAITYFYLKADANNSNTYFKCESNARIEITYTK